MASKQLVTLPAFSKGLGGRLWSPGLKVGPWLFLSGVTAVDYDTMTTVGASGGTSMTPARLDPEAQWRQALSNIKQLVEAAGGTMADVVLANVYVTDMQYYAHYQHIRGEFFTPPYPVCTAIAVRSLVHPDWLLEIEAIAYIEDPPAQRPRGRGERRWATAGPSATQPRPERSAQRRPGRDHDAGPGGREVQILRRRQT
ncbi:MAG: RidA family protein [Armatimonadota bacterium]|nr:RidA family protein [Armatimonadota bacterium]MDR7450897.1 RidA family protein [Armatimonadota bacterium]MDR7465819.1 RidA family protein [Armatimonadota bacterium]MDR7493727.1 RidA family protein [Armatimonadota bacterium]MDR7498333.1 RidA family protein [Armatimonadota bacterium]